MNITVRELDPQTDYERVAAIINCYEPEDEAITPEQLHESDKHDSSGQIYHRIVAVDDAGRVIGYGAVMHTAWMKPNNFMVLALVDPAHCKQGVGTRLHQSNLEFARENGATAVNTWVFDNQPQAVRFAEKHGFSV